MSSKPPSTPSLGDVKPRKGPKPRPQLPLSAFTPPNTGTADSFPEPSIPNTFHPTIVIDAHVIGDGDISLTQWKREMGQSLGGRLGGVVLSLCERDVEDVTNRLESSHSSTPIISLVFPFNLEDKEHKMPSISSASHIGISLSTAFTRSTPQGVESLRWALQAGRPVDIDIQTPISDEVLEELEDIISKATAGLSQVPPIVLSNILPPPHDLQLPIMKLINDPTYLAFESQAAALSLFSNVYVKYLPPSWNAPTPSETTSEVTEPKQKQEWGPRVMMYLGPIIEAFGYERVIFGSSPSPASGGSSHVDDWYEVARETLVALGVGQDAVDAVFYGNAKKVYGTK